MFKKNMSSIEKILFGLLILCIICPLLTYIYIYYFDPDGFFILTEGRYIFASGIPETHPHHITEGLHIVMQQWLYNVIVYWIYDLAGNAGMFLFVVLQAIMVAGSVYYLSRRYQIGPCFSVLITLLFLHINQAILTIRPNLLTTFLLLLQLICTELYLEKGEKRFLIGIVLTTWAEINLHASMWIMHFLFLFAYVFPALSVFDSAIVFFKNDEKRKNRKKTLLYLYLPMTFVLFLNPYGIDNILYLFRSFGEQLQSLSIVELNVIPIVSDFGITWILGLIAYIVFFIKKKEITSEMFYLFVGNMIIGCTYIRNFYYCSFAVLIIVLSFLEGKEWKISSKLQMNLKPLIGITAIFLCLSLFEAGISLKNAKEEPLWAKPNEYSESADSVITPTKALRYIQNNTEDTDISLYTDFNNGAFFEWNGYKIYVDARPELYLKKINQKDDILEEYIILRQNLDKEYYQKWKEKYDFSYYLVEKKHMLNAFLQMDTDMEVCLQTEKYCLYKPITKGNRK